MEHVLHWKNLKLTNNANKLNRLKIPTCRKQVSWLRKGAPEELNDGPPGINPAGSQSWTFIRQKLFVVLWTKIPLFCFCQVSMLHLHQLPCKQSCVIIVIFVVVQRVIVALRPAAKTLQCIASVVVYYQSGLQQKQYHWKTFGKIFTLIHVCSQTNLQEDQCAKWATEQKNEKWL